MEAPEQLIGLDQARSMYKNYSERRAALIQKYEDSRNEYTKDDKMQQQKMEEAEAEKDSFDVARYVSYDFETIKQYIAYVEQETKKAGIEVSTLRFYFSNYPNKEKFEDGREIKHPRQNSIFLIPTLKKDGEEWAFFAEDVGTAQQKVTILTGQLNDKTTNDTGMIRQETDKMHAGFMPKAMAAKSIAAAAAFGNGGCCILNEGNSAPPPHK